MDTAKTPISEIFPPEIIDLIMRASWPGLRLGLTCRRLQAQITDELVDRWTRPVVDEYIVEESHGDSPIYDEAVHHELPNGVFHGPANVETFTMVYRRGRIVSAEGDYQGNDASFYYHGNMLMITRGEYAEFINDDMSVDVDERRFMFGEWGWNLDDDTESEDGDEISARVKWFDSVFPKMCELVRMQYDLQVDLAEHIATHRSKIDMEVAFPDLDKWPDCHRVTPPNDY